MVRGEDKFGKFKVIEDRICGVCARKHQTVIFYWPSDPSLPRGIRIEDTVLQLTVNLSESLDHQIGVTCGCYAKLHRQVAHIEDKIKARQK